MINMLLRVELTANDTMCHMVTTCSSGMSVFGSWFVLVLPFGMLWQEAARPAMLWFGAHSPLWQEAARPSSMLIVSDPLLLLLLLPALVVWCSAALTWWQLGDRTVVAVVVGCCCHGL